MVRRGETHVLNLFAGEDEALLFRQGEICIPLCFLRVLELFAGDEALLVRWGRHASPPALKLFF